MKFDRAFTAQQQQQQNNHFPNYPSIADDLLIVDELLLIGV